MAEKPELHAITGLPLAGCVQDAVAFLAAGQQTTAWSYNAAFLSENMMSKQHENALSQCRTGVCIHGSSPYQHITHHAP